MIYFAQPVAGGPVKIGYSADVEARLRQLEGYYGRPLALLATMDGGRDEERAVHQQFAHLRLPGEREQFRPVPELLAFIGRPLLVSPDPDVVVAMERTARLTNIRSSPEWKEWLHRFADHVRKDVADAVDEGMMRYARAEGFEPPPKR